MEQQSDQTVKNNALQSVVMSLAYVDRLTIIQTLKATAVFYSVEKEVLCP